MQKRVTLRNGKGTISATGRHVAVPLLPKGLEIYYAARPKLYVDGSPWVPPTGWMSGKPGDLQPYRAEVIPVEARYIVSEERQLPSCRHPDLAAGADSKASVALGGADRADEDEPVFLGQPAEPLRD